MLEIMPEIENLFNEESTQNILNKFNEESSEKSVAENELMTLSLTTDKYKPLVIDGVSIPSTVRTDCIDKPFIFKNERNISELTKDEIDWLNTNINFIIDANGDFIQITSGNQFVFYQTLLRIQYFIWSHLIPRQFFMDKNNPNEIDNRYYKIFNIGELIEIENCDSSYIPEYRICVDMNMSAHVKDKPHAIKKFKYETHNLFGDMVNLVQYTVDKRSGQATAKTQSRLVFNTLELFNEWIEKFVITRKENINENNIVNMFPNLKPLYLNSKSKTTDTFGFFANPKCWITEMKSGFDSDFKLNIVIFPEFIGKINLTTWHSNFKDIEVGLEQLSDRCKAICDSHIYKKV